MSIDTGWNELHSGNAAQAARTFEAAIRGQGPSTSAYTGLVRAHIAQGDLGQAQAWAEAASGEIPDTDLMLLMAEVMSARGKRAEASSLLQHVLADRPQDSFALALMAEQRIRQGYWEDGTQRFIGALGVDDTGEAFIHLQNVLADLVEAVVARRVKPVDAIKFVNKVDYTAPKTNPQLAPFLARARRSLNSGTPLERPRASAPTARPSAPSPVSAPARPVAQPSPQRAAARASAPAPSRPRPVQIDAQLPARQVAFLEAMRQDRALNEALQENIGEFRPSTWPSELTEPIDIISPIGFSGLTISEQIEDKRRMVFNVTEGSIRAEIYLERALQSMLDVIPVELTGTVQMMPEELAMLEHNAFDGFFEKIAEPVTTDLDENFPVMDVRVAALGTFLGRCIVNGYAGTWSFDTDPSKSVVRVDSDELDVFEVASRWVASPTVTSLHALLSRAEESQSEEQFSGRIYEHIDLTAGLTDRALITKLVELYSFYRFDLVRVPATELIEGTSLVLDSEDIVVFSLHRKWLPMMPREMFERGKRRDGGYAIAYLRETGEFLALSRLKDLALALEYLVPEGLTSSSASSLLDVLAAYFCPSAKIVRTAPDVQELASRGAKGVAAPTIGRTQQGDPALVFWTVEGSNARRYTLAYDETALYPWTVL